MWKQMRATSSTPSGPSNPPAGLSDHSDYSAPSGPSDPSRGYGQAVLLPSGGGDGHGGGGYGHGHGRGHGNGYVNSSSSRPQSYNDHDIPRRQEPLNDHNMQQHVGGTGRVATAQARQQQAYGDEMERVVESRLSFYSHAGDGRDEVPDSARRRRGRRVRPDSNASARSAARGAEGGQLSGMGGQVDRFDDHSAPTRERQKRGDQKNQQRALESSEDRVRVWCMYVIMCRRARHRVCAVLVVRRGRVQRFADLLRRHTLSAWQSLGSADK